MAAVYALRSVRRQRQYKTLGSDADGLDPRDAEEALKNELARVQLGSGSRRGPSPRHSPRTSPTPPSTSLASDWWNGQGDRCPPTRASTTKWQLSSHLLPFFKDHQLSQITVAEVDRYRRTKVAERSLSAASINKTLTRLGQILDQANEYDLLPQGNPMRVNPRNRKLKATRPAAVWLDRADQITSLLDAAGELDRRAGAGRRHVPRRVMLAAWCSLDYGSVSCSDSGGAMWTSPPVGSGLPVLPTRTATDTLRPKRACGPSRCCRRLRQGSRPIGPTTRTPSRTS